jgi:RNase H-like domain found in reverse transcriptase/Integrase zinc binding domain
MTSSSHENQKHEPLAFLSGSFAGPPYRWAIVRKEAYAVLATCDRMDWLLNTSEGFSLFTDHRNLTYCFDPYGTNPNMSKQTACKLVRWAPRLSSYNYTIEYITGMDNLWADLMTRWAAPLARIRMSRLFVAPLAPFLADDFIWPTESELDDLQRSNEPCVLPTATRSTAASLLKTKDGCIWIPDAAVDTQLRLCIIAHCGRGGHRGASVTCAVLAKLVTWSTLTEDSETFCKSCLHCVATLGGLRTPRPLGEAVHAERPNHVLRFDFCSWVWRLRDRSTF